MQKITTLTPAQEHDLRHFHAECMAIGTSTERADRPRAEAAITAMYAHVGKPAPQFIWCGSPATSILAAKVLRRDRVSLGGSLWDSLRVSLEDSLWVSLRESLGGSLWDSLWVSLGDSLRVSLGDSLRVSLRESLWVSLGVSLWDSLWESLGDSLGDSRFYGQHELHWIAFYRFCEQIGVRYAPEKSTHLQWWWEIANSACWWWPYESACIISERPEVCRINDERRLHSDNGPAMRFRDGWTLWAVGGVYLPTDGEQIVLRPGTQTLDQIDSEQNAEIKRIRIERFGWQSYLTKKNARVLDHRCNDIEQTEEALMRSGDMTVLVCACPSTAKVFAMEVDPSCETCEQAQNYLSGNRAARIVGAT